AVERRLQRHLARLAVQRQLSDHAEAVPAARLDAGAGEGDGRVLLDVEEVGRAQVRVALGVAGGNRGRVDLGPDGRAARVVGDVQDSAADAGEAALDGGDHHVADAELDQAVGGVDLPGGQGLGGRGGGDAHAGDLA